MEVSGAADLAGLLEVSLINSFTPTYGNRFIIMTFATRSGAFNTYSGVFISGDTTLAPIYGISDLTLNAVIPGDGNVDGVVNFEDFALLPNNFGATGTVWNQGNFNLDGITNFTDFVILSNRFGQQITSGAIEGGVPEPTVTLSLGLAVSAFLSRRQTGRDNMKR